MTAVVARGWAFPSGGARAQRWPRGTGCGTPLGATAPAHEVRKTVTALFCDLVGSTTLGERHDPEVVRPLLHAYFEDGDAR
jgi:class 3 adenylate cyclase